MSEPVAGRRPLRVVIVIGTSTGGVGTHVRSVIDRLPGDEFSTTVVGPPATEGQFAFTDAGATFVPVVMSTAPRPRHDLAAVRRIRQAISDAGADVVHAHGFRAAALTGLALGRRRSGRVPFVATWHNAVLGGGPRRRALAALETLAARRADLTLGASKDLVARAVALGAPAARSAPVAAPTLPPPNRDPAAIRREIGAAGRRLVLAVGRLAPQKDYATMLAAVRLLVSRHGGDEFVLAVAGDGPERGSLQAFVDTHRLPVRLLGHRGDIADLLRAADVYVLSSRWEARALVVQEAMQAGTPVVATDVGGIPELTGDGADAYLVRPGDPTALAEALHRVLADDALRADLADRGRRRAETWPDEDATAADLADVYRRLVDAG